MAAMDFMIPADKYDVAALERYWAYVLDDISGVEKNEFGKLAAKTYQLFLDYQKDDTVPKVLIDLICLLESVEKIDVCEKFTLSDIITAVAAALLVRLKNEENCYSDFERFETCEGVFVIAYNNEWYKLNINTFDVTPIIERQSAKIDFR